MDYKYDDHRYDDQRNQEESGANTQPCVAIKRPAPILKMSNPASAADPYVVAFSSVRK